MTDTDPIAWAAALRLLARFESAGHTAYLVGGCVRDRLLGRKLHDIDIATSATPEQVIAMFPNAIPTGLAHGTVTVRDEGHSFEVTTYRREGKYTDSRRPDKVSFVGNVEEDLARRDFTINAIAWGRDGATVDPFGGAADLRRGIVRTVGEAAERFSEDALRLLRGIRFAAEFGFEFAPKTWDGLLGQRERLRHIAMERVGTELDKIMAGSDPDRAFALLAESGLLRFAREPLPPSAALPPGGTGGGASGLKRLADPDLRWCALLLGGGAAPDEAEAVFRSLCLGVKRGARVAAVVGLSRRLAADANAAKTAPSRTDELGETERTDVNGPVREQLRRSWTLAVLEFGRPAAEDWLALAAACPEAALGSLEPGFAERARDWLGRMAATAIGGLAVRGDEVAEAVGKKPGPWVAKTLRRLLEAVALGRLPNERDALLAEAAAVEGDIGGNRDSKEGTK
ncbi:CCA tRNA nucleotidyltransferase [Cohnella massiliensis]|uniref:CCA tRNA nucleotidyltransferase n=1 Tax=Cohnella massiliensis TaxID=1816691 RepID=UPI0009BC5F78|nr:CCA tRNA nucleotidyltransferase [Cohnella massiliensis]